MTERGSHITKRGSHDKERWSHDKERRRKLRLIVYRFDDCNRLGFAKNAQLSQ